MRRTQGSDYLLLILRCSHILTLLWPYAFSVLFQSYGVALSYTGQSTERTWAVEMGAELRRGDLRMVRVQMILGEARRNGSESQGKGTLVGEEGLWPGNE